MFLFRNLCTAPYPRYPAERAIRLRRLYTFSETVMTLNPGFGTNTTMVYGEEGFIKVLYLVLYPTYPL